MKRVLLVCAAWLAGLEREGSGAMAPPAMVKSEFIYTEAPFPECHASTLAETRQGLCAAWFGGKHEKSPDVGIWLARHSGEQWTAPIEVANGVESQTQRYPCWNPVLFQCKNGPLLLFYKVGPSPDRWWGMLMSSQDGGLSWSKSRRLPDHIIGPVKNKPIELANGDLLCGSSTEHAGWRVHFERTPDCGNTWTSTEPVNDSRELGAIQPSFLVHGQKRLQALGRTTRGRIFSIWSDNNGTTWGQMTLTELPNPNAGTDAVTLRDGRHLLVYNHTSRGRSPLNVALSKDGLQWQAALVLENEPGSEFSYPAVIQTGDGRVHMTYTWKRQRIKHVILDPGQFELRPILQGKWPE
jgi:predicted neuraminidase